MIAAALLPVVAFVVVVNLESPPAATPAASVEIAHTPPAMSIPAPPVEPIPTHASQTVAPATLTRKVESEPAGDSTLLLATAVAPAPVTQPTISDAARERLLALDHGRKALQRNIQLLEAGCRTFRAFPHYSANFTRQERVAGELCPLEEIEMKVRHEPFSVFMHWLSVDAGRQLLFVNGTNDGRMLVRLGGWKGRVLPTLNIDPLGEDARERSRYPISRAGILALAELMLEHRRADLMRNVSLRCDYAENRELNGRNCYYFCFEFEAPEESDVYRKSVQYIDSVWHVPVCVQNYTWPDNRGQENAVSLDDDTLIEYYSYSEIDTGLRLSDVDFDRENPDYRFR